MSVQFGADPNKSLDLVNLNIVWSGDCWALLFLGDYRTAEYLHCTSHFSDTNTNECVSGTFNEGVLQNV